MATRRTIPVARPKKTGRKNAKARRRGLLRRVIWFVAAGFAVYYCFLGLLLLGLRFLSPPTTAVQMERRIAAWRAGEPYHKRFRFVPLDSISPQLQHAVIAAEDARFFQHHGFDWKEVESAVQQDIESGRRRGASTITQQLVRNLFLNTDPSLLRKAFEFSIVPVTEAILPKRRILELYLNVIEWGAGVYGAEAAAEFYYHRPAGQLNRDQAVALASVLPAPLHRRPGQVEWYARRIRERMREMGW